MSIAKRIAGWGEMPKDDDYAWGDTGPIYANECSALRDRLRDTAAVLGHLYYTCKQGVDPFDKRARTTAANDARAILAKLAEEGLIGSAQEDKP